MWIGEHRLYYLNNIDSTIIGTYIIYAGECPSGIYNTQSISRYNIILLYIDRLG